MYYFLLYFLIFIFGGAIGSFINVLVDRLYIKSPFKGRSQCEKCSRTLSWYEMIPVFSYLFQNGKCRKCKTKIGSKHFWVEFLTGILAVLTYKFILSSYFPDIVSLSLSSLKDSSVGIMFSALYILLFIVLIAIFMYDLKHKIVPLQFSLLLLVIGLAFEAYRLINFSTFYGGFTSIFWLDLFSGFLIALPFLLIYTFSNGKAVGFGDVILFFAIGYLTGFIFGVSVFLLSIWIGAATSILLMYFLPKRYSRKSEVPFAPFIVIATIIVLFLQIDILGLSNFLH